ncbi:MAG: hypothetical protein R3336_06035, partial [Phycisphaeraceae bacterium]|nr:hypothetical protein [Phycisphaeraceae bacterium]
STETVTPNDTTWALDHPATADADWLIPTVEGHNPPGELVRTDLEASDNQGFTSDHLAFTAEMNYPDARLALRFHVWVYPDSPGLRTQLSVRALDGYTFDAQLSREETTDASRLAARRARGCHRQSMLPMTFEGTTRRMAGYYAGTQTRNDPHLSLLHEATETRPITHPATCDWASLICVETESSAVAMVKESHKCVNTIGHDCGVFTCDPDLGLVNYGWGILPQEIDDQWRPGWASWTLGYVPGERSRQRAFKTFDRIRYPLDQRDIYIQANTWGSSQGHKEHRDAAGEANVIQEIESCADLGIDVLQIDDGWQGDQYETWEPVPPRYPDGWTRVKEKAAEAGVKLGLWMAALPPSLEEMKTNIREGGFVSLKLDFAVLNSREKIDGLITKTRRLVLDCDHDLRVNWDLTEACPRYGYFFAREYGCIYLENRKPVVPSTVVYRPGTVLRDLWELARYCNLLKFQGSVQNLAMVDPRLSNAGAYNQAYCTAIPLFSSPLFFCETHFFDESQRAEIRPVLSAYKKVRDDIYQGIIYPIGDRPDGTSWTGFQSQGPDRHRGYLMLFREPWNTEPTHAFRLPDLAGQSLEITDLMRQTSWTATADDQGHVEFAIDNPGDFRFLAYQAV